MISLRTFLKSSYQAFQSSSLMTPVRTYIAATTIRTPLKAKILTRKNGLRILKTLPEDGPQSLKWEEALAISPHSSIYIGRNEASPLANETLYSIPTETWHTFIAALPQQNLVRKLNLAEQRHLWPAYNYVTSGHVYNADM